MSVIYRELGLEMNGRRVRLFDLVTGATVESADPWQDYHASQLPREDRIRHVYVFELPEDDPRRTAYRATYPA